MKKVGSLCSPVPKLEYQIIEEASTKTETVVSMVRVGDTVVVQKANGRITVLKQVETQSFSKGAYTCEGLSCRAECQQGFDSRVCRKLQTADAIGIGWWSISRCERIVPQGFLPVGVASDARTKNGSEYHRGLSTR